MISAKTWVYSVLQEQAHIEMMPELILKDR